MDDGLSFLPDHDQHSLKDFMFMSLMEHHGITPEKYTQFLASTKKEERENMAQLFEDAVLGGSGIFDNDDAMDFDDNPFLVEAPRAIPDADKKSLRLKIQMKDVTKPPFWREVTVPADFSFLQLHYVIQTVTGFCDSHLWHFQKKPYGGDLCIAIPYNDFTGEGVDRLTNDADETPLTSFLARKGDKLVYTYDFGDDWMFDITVQEVADRKADHPVLEKWKSNLQPIEDTGGPMAYADMRKFMDNPEAASKSTIKWLSDIFGASGINDIIEELHASCIDPEEVNSDLADISDFPEED